MSDDRPEDKLPSGRLWLVAGIACVAILVVTDAILLEVTRGGLRTGFGGVLLDRADLRAGYAGLSALIDLFLVLAIWIPLVPLLQRAGVRPWRNLACCSVAALAAAGWADVLIYRLHQTIGALVTPGVVMELAGGDVETFYEAGTLATGVLLMCGFGTLAAFSIAVRASDRLAAHLPDAGRHFEPPRVRVLLALATFAFASAAALLAAPSPTIERLREASRMQPSAGLLTGLANWLSDFDFDGAGLLSRPPDPAPFDARVHTFALDRPGNGEDENRLAGDLPAGTLPPSTTPTLPPSGSVRPHLLVLYLESFRYDLLGSHFEGRAVTPFFDELALSGASSAHAYVHSPYTARSRAQLFSGSLTPLPNAPTWIDDFATLGYRVAYFSGQDDSFGDSETLLGVERADLFYDARRDTARRTSRSTARASLQVSWKLLAERVETFLDEVRAAQPLFLYVNIVDTHYPYNHEDLEPLLDGTPVDRSEIRSANRERVWETYLNAAANVDRAAERLVGAFRQAIGGAPHAIIVTSDHGQTFYEDGTLGHGRALDRLQTQVPLIVWGLSGTWPEPIGAADLRGLVLRSLDAPANGAVHFEPRPGRRVFQFLPNLERPALIASRGIDEAVVYDFARGTASAEDGSEVAADDPRVLELIHGWEALRVAMSATQGD